MSSTSKPDRIQRRNPSRRRGGVIAALLVGLVLVGVTGFVGYKMFWAGDGEISADDLITTPVVRGPFDHIVLEQGEIESSSNIEIVCEVESRGMGGTPILWVIDEGSKVKKGDKLVELDGSSLEDLLKNQRILVIAAKANVATAEAQVKQAKIAREEYLKGVYMTEEKTIESEIAVAQQDLSKAQLALESTERLVAKGLAKSLQLDADRYAVVNARNQLESAEGRLRVLQNLTRQKMLVQFDSDIDAAEATQAAMQSELNEKEKEESDLEQQIQNCVMYAPADGVVVHANKFSSRGGSEFVVEAGASVRERQAIINLPDPTQMQIKCEINESRITLIDSGMPVKIKIDALPNMALRGRVTKVNRYAEPGSWFSSSVKEYATYVQIIDPPESIRTGMTASCEIFVEQLDDALQIPIQGIYEHGDNMYAMVQKGPNKFDTREVQIDATNDTMAAIGDGLSVDEKVVLNLRDHLNLMDLPELAAEDNSDLKDLRQAGGPSADGPPADGPSDGGRGPGGDAGERRGGGKAAGGKPGGGDGPGGGRGGPGGGRGGGDPNAMIQRMDKNGDGKLAVSELPGQFGERMKPADKDGDGFLSVAELTAAFKTMQQRGGGGGRPGGGGPGGPQ